MFGAIQVISTARTCNLILIVLDCLKPISHKKLIEHELEGFGIRLNKTPPAISFRRKEKGGINFSTTVQNPKLDVDGAHLITQLPGKRMSNSIKTISLIGGWPSKSGTKTGK